MRKYLVLLFLPILLVGCKDFDRDAFNTLSVSNSVLKTAQQDYETGALPHNQCAYDIINKGKTAQQVAETAFLDYYQVEVAKGDVSASQATLLADLTQIAPLVAEVKSLYSSPSCGTTTVDSSEESKSSVRYAITPGVN